MNQTLLFAADLLAIGLLAYAVYFPRHHRRDLVLAYLAVNLGVLAVSAALASSGVSAGVGLGLFGVLAIIRLRSTELDQNEVAYFFVSLALGLLGGLGAADVGLSTALMAVLVAAMYGAGHPRLLRRHRRHLMVLDTAFVDEAALVAHLEQLLGARVHQVSVQKVDQVQDTTTVDVRFERAARAPFATQVVAEAPRAAPRADVPAFPSAPAACGPVSGCTDDRIPA